jgi:hypothetical protein
MEEEGLGDKVPAHSVNFIHWSQFFSLFPYSDRLIEDFSIPPSPPAAIPPNARSYCMLCLGSDLILEILSSSKVVTGTSLLNIGNLFDDF